MTTVQQARAAVAAVSQNGVRHVVMFKFKEGSDKATVCKLFSEGLAQMPAAVSGHGTAQHASATSAQYLFLS
jgi:hypothetical protein